MTEDGRFHGMILRNQLLVLLERRVFVEDPATSGIIIITNKTKIKKDKKDKNDE